MRQRPSIAQSLMDRGALLDGRYRLDKLVRRSATATIHLATHRNGSSAWLKLPLEAAHAKLLALESQIASTIGSPLLIRDDGATPEGVPYLVLDPPNAESVAALRARGRTGGLLLARVMTVGDALARVVASLHALGYVTAGLGDEDVLVFANGDVALLELHALVPATPAGIAEDLMHLRSALWGLVADAAAAGPVRAVIDAALAPKYPDVAALQAAWRAASPEPIAPPSRAPRSGSLADSTPFLPPDEGPPSAPAPAAPVVVVAPYARGDSVIGYLRSGDMPSIPPPASRAQDRAVMYDPLSKVAEVPRLVQATIAPESAERAPRKHVLVGVLIATTVTTLLTGAAFVMTGPSRHPTTATTATTASASVELPASTETPPPAPVTVVAAPPASTAEPVDELELNALLRTEGAPPGRDVFIDGKSVGQTPLQVSVPCGRHTLQMVAGAPKQAVELPCGGERVVRYDAAGRWSLR